MADDIDDPVGDPPVPEPKPKAKVPPKSDPVEPEEMSQEELAAEFRKLRKAQKESNAEAQKGREARRRLQELEDEREKLEQAKLSEDEKRERRIKAAEDRARESDEKAARLERENLQMRIDDAVKAEADALGFSAWRDLIADAIRGKSDRGGIDVDTDTSKFLGVKDAVKKYTAQFPEMGTGRMVRGGGTPPRASEPYRVPSRESRVEAGDPPADIADIDRQKLASVGYYAL